jgi:hypothetical protein
VKRNGFKAMYEQTFEGNLIAFEVFKVKTRKESEVFGKIIPLREVFPSDESFGSTAWTLSNIDRANEVYDNLEQTIKN